MSRTAYAWMFTTLLIVALGCAKATTPDPIGGETHFLQACDDTASCGLGLDCVCGVCTKPCVSDNTCKDESAGATCEAAGTPIGACVSPGSSPVCDVECTLDADCTTLGPSYTCELGSCRKLNSGSCIVGGVTYPACNDSDASVLQCGVGFVSNGVTCVECPAGYYGTGTECAPTLTVITLSSGTLSPALSNEFTSYAADVDMGTQTITLTLAAPSAATITINGDAVASDQAWQSPVLDLGANTITVVVSQPGRPRRTYTLTVSRGGSQQAYLKAGNTGRHGFGESVAISDDTLVVGAPLEGSGGAVYVFTRSGDTWSQQAYLKASNAEEGDYFGDTVAISGDTLVVGAYVESSNATGVNGDEANNDQFASGAAYVFTRSGDSWSQQAYLKASNAEGNDRFGWSVAISGDTLVVGAWDEGSNATGVNGDQGDNSAFASGAAYVFTRSGSTWSQQAYLKASNTGFGDYFGDSVAISGDTLVVGAWGEDSSATGVNGDQADNSVGFSGAVYVFTRSGSTWSQQAYLKASNTGARDQFGESVAISGDTLVVGASYEASNATGINGDQADNSADRSGAAYVFTRSGDTWSQQAYLKASNTEAADYFGGSVAISGDTLVVGAWCEDSSATGINGDQADNSASWSGAAYVFTRSGSTWSQQAYLKASNAEADDRFGTSVAISGDTLVVGARDEDSSATGVNGDQTDNSMDLAGAVYVFR